MDLFGRNTVCKSSSFYIGPTKSCIRVRVLGTISIINHMMQLLIDWLHSAKAPKNTHFISSCKSNQTPPSTVRCDFP